jgi:hypothetical protein
MGSSKTSFSRFVKYVRSIGEFINFVLSLTFIMIYDLRIYDLLIHDLLIHDLLIHDLLIHDLLIHIHNDS